MTTAKKRVGGKSKRAKREEENRLGAWSKVPKSDGFVHKNSSAPSHKAGGTPLGSSDRKRLLLIPLL